MMKVKNNNVWFCSDPHYSHKNICRGVSNWPKTNYTRDFKNLDEMNGALVKNINQNVGEDDILFCLGDWSFGGIDKISKFRNQLRCQEIHLILGNHDHHIEDNYDIQEMFTSVNNYLELEVDSQKFVLSHYPFASWNGLHKGWIHLFGHCHLTPKYKIREGRCMDVGFDGNPNFRPYHISEVVSILGNRPISSITIPKEVDHHL